MGAPELATERLLLRRWRASDRAPFARLNASPEVMEYFPSTLTTTQSDVFAELIDIGLVERPFGLWAVEVVGLVPFVGFVGLSVPTWDAPFMPCVEVGWRLDSPHWGLGYATEAASEVLRYAFGELVLPEIVSFTSKVNLRSRAVMDRLGMVRDSTMDFDHPNLEAGHHLTPHVLYRMTASRWTQ